jgi:hypothetical protein
MNTALALTLSLTFAAGDFDAAKEKAVEVESLKTAVTTLVGLCEVGDQFERAQCRQGLATKAKEMRKSSHYLYLGPQDRGLMFEGERRGKTRLVWSPVVDAGNGLAITLVRPKRLSKHGNVVVPQKPIDITLEPGVLDSEVKRFVRTGQVTIEVVGSFGKTWKVGKGKKRVQGVVFKPKSIRFAHARTGKTLGSASY